MSTKYEYYDGAANTYDRIYGIEWRAQTFTPSIAHKITSVKLLLYRRLSPGTLTVSIRATDGSGHPTGGDLCSGTTNSNTLPTASPFEWREITLGAGCDLSADTKYAIVIRAIDGDASNDVRWRSDNTDPTYAGGCREWSSNSGAEESWSSVTTQDSLFEEWGELVEKTGADTGSGVDSSSQAATLTKSETGSGLEALGSRLLGAAEEGGGAETLLARLLASTETASGLEVGAIFFSSSDVGSGLDAILVLQALLTGADSGSGIDTSFIIKALLSADSGLGIEAVAALLAGIVAGELMVGSDCLVVKIESAPKGGGMRLPPGGKTSIPSRRVNL